jgi:hypothetical protein
MEAEAESHVEAIKAVAEMLITDAAAGAPCTAQELERERGRAVGGLYKLNSVIPRSLKAPGFNAWNLKCDS